MMIMVRTFVMGDCHGNYRALKQCLERSNFNKEEDTLIQLGDIVDGFMDVYECVEELLSIKNLICIKGNHDCWLLEWMTKGQHPCYWLHGGEGTLLSYCKHSGKEYVPSDGGYKSNLTILDVPKSHIELFKNQRLYYIDSENNFFVHGGFDRDKYVDYLEYTDPVDFYWNRKLWNEAQSCSKGQKLRTADNFTKIFIGHTCTNFTHKDWKPVFSGGVWNLDQGAGWNGKLTIMNVDTEEYFQSDLCKDLYPKGHNTR